MEKHDLTLEAAAIAAAGRAMAPYEAELGRFRNEVEQLKSEVERKTNEVTSLKAEVQQLKESAERIARFATAERDLLAKQVKADSEAWAEAKVKDVIKHTFTTLGIDIDKPTEFSARMRDLDKFIEAIDSTKKTSAKVIIGSIVAGCLALFWTAFKGSLLKP